MNPSSLWIALLLGSSLLTGCEGERAHASATPRAGGRATVFDFTRDAFSLPAPNLSESHRTQFFVGNSFFNQNWVSAPASASGRDGLGPLFNARSCSGCHFKDGRGRPPEPGEPMRSMLMRISIEGEGPHGAPLPDPVYGTQLQGSALPGAPREADIYVTYEAISGAFPDGEPYELLHPTYRVEALGYGPTADTLHLSPRVAPFIIGLGLLEAIPESSLLALADPEDANGDGISGRTNLVWDHGRQVPRIGRFGWKAEQPSVRQQSAAAFLGDMGLTSSLFASENHSEGQLAALRLPSGGNPEVSDQALSSVTLYAQTLAVPARRNLDAPDVLAGEALFQRIGCASCHVPTLQTGTHPDVPELSGQTIHPYTDLLLHDMGEALSDGRKTFAARGNEWRTPPLWGIGLVAKVNGHTFFLHDGRARNLQEAVLWHGGEAEHARSSYENLARAQRSALLAFLHSL